MHVRVDYKRIELDRAARRRLLGQDVRPRVQANEGVALWVAVGVIALIGLGLIGLGAVMWHESPESRWDAAWEARP